MSKIVEEICNVNNFGKKMQFQKTVGAISLKVTRNVKAAKENLQWVQWEHIEIPVI